MSPIVEQMLESTHTRDLELVELEDLFTKDCECESDHINIAPCTKIIVARKTTACGTDILICSASYAWNMIRMADSQKRRCAECGSTLFECWKIRPV